MNAFFQGFEQVLYIKFNGVFAPVACLTSNSFSESLDFIDTTTVQNASWKTSQPTNQGYVINLSGLLIEDLAGADADKISLYKLRSIKRARTLIDWEIRTRNVAFIDSGKAHIENINEDSPAEGFITFSATLRGYGQPFQSNNILPSVTWDSTTVTFDSTDVTWDKT